MGTGGLIGILFSEDWAVMCNCKAGFRSCVWVFGFGVFLFLFLAVVPVFREKGILLPLNNEGTVEISCYYLLVVLCNYFLCSLKKHLPYIFVSFL